MITKALVASHLAQASQSAFDSEDQERLAKLRSIHARVVEHVPAPSASFQKPSSKTHGSQMIGNSNKLRTTATTDGAPIPPRPAQMREMRLTVLAHITRAAGPNKESDEVLATRVQNTVAARNECKIKQAELANGIETLKSVFMNPYAELKPAKSIVGPTVDLVKLRTFHAAALAKAEPPSNNITLPPPSRSGRALAHGQATRKVRDRRGKERTNQNRNIMVIAS